MFIRIKTNMNQTNIDTDASNKSGTWEVIPGDESTIPQERMQVLSPSFRAVGQLKIMSPSTKVVSPEKASEPSTKSIILSRRMRPSKTTFNDQILRMRNSIKIDDTNDDVIDEEKSLEDLDLDGLQEKNTLHRV